MVTPHPHQFWWWRWADLIRHFLVWLFWDGSIKIYQLWYGTAANFEAQLAVIVTLKNITKPLYQDYTREGRVAGFILRLGRIFIGTIVQVVVALVFTAILLAWLALPFYLLYQISRNSLAVFGYN